jgi:hypothetical protein
VTTHLRIFSTLALLGATLAGLAQYRPAWAADHSLDWWNLADLREQTRRDERELAECDQGKAERAARQAARAAVIKDLRAGRLSLAQAAAEFLRLVAGISPVQPQLIKADAAATELEHVCRQVVSWAEADAAAESPAAARQTRERLEQELSRLLAQHDGAI